MYHMLAIVSFCLLATGLAAPRAVQPRDDPLWTLRSFQRICQPDDCQCVFRFQILEGADDPAPSPCEFTIYGADDTPASRVSFSDAACNGSDAYAISSGWDAAGFIVASVVDRAGGLVAYFGFEDEDLRDGQPAADQTSAATPLFPAPARRSADPASDATTALEKAGEWTVGGFERHVVDHGAFLGFSIAGDNQTQTCFLVVDVPEDQDPKTWSFFSHKCHNTDWRVSWGYKPELDGGVMTLVNPQQDKDAWFGWDNINDRTQFETAGPNPTFDI